MEHPALGLLEFNSIAGGIQAADEVLKKASVEMILARTICPGKYLIIINGEVDEVKASVESGTESGRFHLVDSIVIPNLHPTVPPALIGATEISAVGSLGIVETYSAPSAILSADAAVKAAAVTLIEIRVANGIGGKSFYSVTGEESAVRASIEQGIDFIKESGLLMNFIVIPSPHRDLYRHIV